MAHRRFTHWPAALFSLRPLLRAPLALLLLLTTTALSAAPAAPAPAAVAPAVAAPVPEPLPARIDRLLAATFPGPVVPPASDADFLRRAHLDFTGAIPTATEVRAFLADAAPDKRANLINRLLVSREFVRHFSGVVDIWLMERRGEKHVKIAEWQQFLFNSFATNKPYDLLVREILSADSADEKQRPAARFLLDREAEPNLLTRDVGRIFFGMDLSCAQCHDHPRIDDYLQRDYHGLYAFLNRTYLFTDDKAKKSFVAEKAEGDVSFASVFTKETGATGPRLPGSVSLTEPILAKGDDYLVKPDPTDKNVRPVPKFSRRAQLAVAATDGTNRAFNRNLANRLWKHLMGRGLVDPVDELHSANPATSPALLDVLADELVALKYNTRAFLRQLALTQTYQRSIELPPVLTSPDQPSASRVTELEEEVKRLAAAAAQSDEIHKKALAALAPVQKARDAIVAELAKTNAAIAEVKKISDAAAQAQTNLEKSLATKRDALKSLLTAVTNAQDAIVKLAPETNLVAAVDQFKGRVAKLTNEVELATKDLPVKAAALKAALEKLTAIELTAKPVLARLADADKPVRKLEDDLAAATAKRQADHTGQHHAEKRLGLAKLFADYEAQTAALTAARADVAQTHAKLATVQAVLTRHDELAAAQLALDAFHPPRSAGGPPASAAPLITPPPAAATTNSPTIKTNAPVAAPPVAATTNSPALKTNTVAAVAAPAGSAGGPPASATPALTPPPAAATTNSPTTKTTPPVAAPPIVTAPNSPAAKTNAVPAVAPAAPATTPPPDVAATNAPAIKTNAVAVAVSPAAAAPTATTTTPAIAPAPTPEARLAFAKAAFAKVAADLAASARQDFTNLQAQLKTAEAHAAATKTRLDEAQSKLSATFTTAFAVGAFVALTPEQLAWSLMKSAGLTLTQQTAAEADFDKKTPPTDATKNDPARLLARAQYVEQFVFDKLKGNVGQFATLFGNSAGEPQDVFYATADQALFFSNAGILRGWLAPGAGNLVERCAKLTDPKALAEELYLSTLTRLPADDELAAVRKFLEARPKEIPAVVQELAWGLLTSVEFRFKH